MSTDPYPEVGVDESGIPPGQSARSSEWPKKIRTLTASELDRLTIDGDGRFYWDGRLVNYEASQPQQPEHANADEREQSAMDIIDRAVHELGEHRTSEPTEGADLPPPVEAVDMVHHEGHAEPEPEPEPAPQSVHEAHNALDLDMTRPVPHHHDVPAEGTDIPMAAYGVPASDRMRLKLSRWQAFGAFLAVFGIIVGALGMAAYGFVAAHQWGCRAGLIQSHCPAPQDMQAPRRPDIPA